jgi:small subunit ribosomal protein S16
VAVKIKLKRMGKIRNPQYRIIVADSRTKRDGRAIEEIGLYHPKEEPSLITVDSARVQYWLSVGAQPTDPVRAILKVTGDWQKFTGTEGAEGTLRTKEAGADKAEVFAKVLAEAHQRDAGAPPAKAAKAAKAKAPKAEAEAETAESGTQTADVPATDAPADAPDSQA